MKNIRPRAILALFTMACAAGDDRSGTNTAPAEAAGDMGATSGMQMSGGNAIRISARQAALAGVTFAVATEAPMERTVRAVSVVVPNERTLGIVNARVAGWVEKLYANETGMYVSIGDPLFELYSPELVTAQEELLLAKQLAATTGGNSLVAAARRRLELWDIPQDVIGEIETSGEVRRSLTIRSPYTGHVLQKDVIEGQMVNVGEQLFMIADLSTVWIEPAIFEQDISLIREGQSAVLTFDAQPGREFHGRVTFIYPTLDMATRTLKVRIEVANPDGVIRPMSYGSVTIRVQGSGGVTVPLTAVLPTGEGDIAFVLRGGSVTPTEVVVGSRGDSTIVVIDGVAPGDTVVASATFLFDSESSLAAARQGMMLNMGMGLDMGGMEMETEDLQMDGGNRGSEPGAGDTTMSGMETEGGGER